MFEEDLDLLLNMFGDNFDWARWYEDDTGDPPDDIFRRIAKWHNYREGNRQIGVLNCGGHEFKDTPKAMYRAMFLLRPSVVDFSDMYKTGTLVDFCSPCGQFLGSLQLFKYETCLYFSCAQKFIQGKSSMIQGGWASCDNGLHCTSEIGNKWFSVVLKALERTWNVYRGNNFRV